MTMTKMLRLSLARFSNSAVALLAGALVGALVLSSCSPAPQAAKGPVTEVSFSILSTEKAQNLEALWTPFLADMEKQTGLKIKPYYGNNYTALIEAMRFNQVQVGWYSNASGREAVDRADGEVFARSSDPSGIDGYNSLIIVPKDSTLTVADLLKCDKTLDFGMGDAKSTSGTIAPLTYLFAPAKVTPERCFKTVRSSNHQNNIEAVAAGLLDAATNNDTSLVRIGRISPEKVEKVKVIWTSPTIPEDPIIYRKDLDPAAKEKIRSFFLTYGTAEGPEGDRQREILKALSFGQFKAADNTHLIPQRQMEATLDLLKAREQGDAKTIAKAEAALKAIQAEAAKLESRTAPEAPADPDTVTP